MRPRLVGRIAPLNASGAVNDLTAADVNAGVLEFAAAILVHAAHQVGHVADLALLRPVDLVAPLAGAAAALELKAVALEDAPIDKAPAVKG